MRQAQTRLLLISSLTALLYGSLPAAAAFTIDPYIQAPGTNTMTVMWESDALEEASVTVGPAEGMAPSIIVAPTPVTSAYKGVKYHVYSVRLADLKPGATYTYTVKMGAAVSEPATFRTFPKKADTFTFIAYGDSRANPSGHEKLASHFLKHKPAFILHSGDMVSEGEKREQWRIDFFQPLADVINQVPLFGARGNHEEGGRNMKLFLSPPDASFGYSFDYGSAIFVCLDMGGSPEDIQWADKDLAVSKATWKIPFCHNPSFNIAGHGMKWGRDTVVPMFRKHKIDLAISGHSHIYERFYPLVPLSEPDAHPITYVVSGGGGARTHESSPNAALAYYSNKQHFMVIKVSPDALIAEARDIDDNVFDSFTIRKQNGVYDKDYLASKKQEEAVTPLKSQKKR